ncbi:MAG: T9SS type A sorting domain-containing protein [Bacteroidota bacterium]|nr:T9SS type A sorting domain-containing protein [Bacteroidota bacterium]
MLFPNPFSDYIDVRGLQNVATLTVYSYTGATLITENIISQSEMRMATETLPSGIYFVKLTNQDGSAKQFKMLKK